MSGGLTNVCIFKITNFGQVLSEVVYTINSMAQQNNTMGCVRTNVTV